MHDTQVLVGIACASSLLAILATVVVVPQLFSEINELNLRVQDGVQVRTRLLNEANVFVSICTGIPREHRLGME